MKRAHVLAAFVAGALIGLSACKMSPTETLKAITAVTDQCIANEIAIAQGCPDRATCEAAIRTERARCDAARARICDAGKGCP